MLPTWLAYTISALLLGALLFVIRRYELNKKRLETEELLKHEQNRIRLQEVELKMRTAQARALAAEAEKSLEKNQMRHRIADDLHDEIGSNLSSIVMLSEMLQNNYNITKETAQKILEIRRIAMLSAESMKDIIWFINPENDRFENLTLRLKDLAASILCNMKLKLSIPEAELLEDANLHFKKNFYLIYKEILNNIIKHSQATYVEIEMNKNDHKLSLSIMDNGIGFDKNKVSNGNGFLSIKNRASKIGGNLEIISDQNQGTMVKLIIEIP